MIVCECEGGDTEEASEEQVLVDKVVPANSFFRISLSAFRAISHVRIVQ